MSEFPSFVYKGKGKHQGNGGTFDLLVVQNAEELSQKLSEGWFLNHGEAILAAKPKVFAETPVFEPAKPVSEPVLDETAPPTREELETKATELGIKFDGRFSDKRISSLIEEALK
jgi:hypothetical protein